MNDMMSYTYLGFLQRRGLFLGFAQTFYECQGLPLKAARELPAGTACEELHQLLAGHIQQLVEINTTVGVFTEGPPLLLLGGINLILVSHVDDLL